MTTVALKTQPPFYAEVEAGRKTVEVRREDRHTFEVGDVLVLEEWRVGSQDGGGHYTGRGCLRVVTHVLRGWGVVDGYAALSLKEADG